jgi:adenylate kinase family enzyme
MTGTIPIGDSTMRSGARHPSDEEVNKVSRLTVGTEVHTPVEWIMVAGPPASGRHSAAAALADQLSASVFGVREYARDHGLPEIPAQDGIDPRGEYTDLTIQHVLRDALLADGLPAPDQSILLPAFPETDSQLLLLHTIAETRQVRTRVLELDAVNVTLAARALHRRPCLSCTDDAAGSPHDDAPAHPGMPIRCRTCGRGLTVRRSDVMTTFIDRVSRYREDRPALYQAAKESAIPWQHLDTTQVSTVQAVTTMAAELLRTPRDVALAYPDGGPADSVPAPRLPPEDRR